MNPGTRIADLAALPGPVVLAIGVFDGVHPGHRAVIERAMRDAADLGGTACVVTFDPHPARILRPEKAPHLLTSTPHKLRLIRALTTRPIGMNALIEQSSRAYHERMERWIDIALEEGVRFFVTSLGNPRWVAERAHAAGVPAAWR